MIVETSYIYFDELDIYQAEQEVLRDPNMELPPAIDIAKELEKTLGFRPFGDEW